MKILIFSNAEFEIVLFIIMQSSWENPHSSIVVCKTAELRAVQGVASTCEGAYIDVRNRTGTELQHRNATQIRRFNLRLFSRELQF